MHIPRPSGTFLSGALLLILAIAAAFFAREKSTQSPEGRNMEGGQSQRSKPRSAGSFPSEESRRLSRVDRIEKLISDQFSEEDEAEFYAYRDGMSLSYTERGLMDFYGQMRNALRGNEDSGAEIFTTYMVGEDEGYGHFINVLIENLGDDFFFQQIQKQPESTQSIILGLIWQVIDRFPLKYQNDGSIPVADNGRYYPKTGELYLKLLEKKLQSDDGQRQKN